MDYPLHGSEELSKAYASGRCRECGSPIQPLGPTSRCQVCDDNYVSYKNSGWGLNDLVDERNQNQVLGLCFYCGSGLDESDERLCRDCKIQSDNGQWRHAQFRRGRPSTSDRNPYINVWESNEVDNAVHLDATYGSIAEQMLSKAKYYKWKAERGGPRGREYLEDARCYIRVAAKMLELEKEVRRKGR